MHRTFFLLILWALAAGSTAAADLVFDSEYLKLAPTPEQETVTAEFSFTYTGEEPITITEVDANCGCIRAETDRDLYTKGETGELRFVFELGSKEGNHVNRVWMAYRKGQPGAELDRSPENDPVPATRKELTVEIDIPAVIAVEPKMTTWTVGSRPEPRVVRVTIDHPEPIHLKSAISSREDVKVKLEEVEAGKTYQLTLVPESTKRKRLGMLTLVTDSPIPRLQKKLAFFRIASPDPVDETSDGEASIPAPASNPSP